MNDIQRYYRCPYEHRLDRLSNTWRITPEECLDMAVRDAVTMADSMLFREGCTMGPDSGVSCFWDAWDRHLPDVHPVPEDSLGLIRFGERCVRNHYRMDRSCDGHMIASGISATVPLDGDHSVTVPIDVVHVSGHTAMVVNYRTDSGVRSSEELSGDMGMLLASKWVLSNISGCSRVCMVWVFLGTGVRVEAVPTVGSMVNALADASTTIRWIERYDDLLPTDIGHNLEQT
ncbi:MAG: hypothetical protein J6K69_04965 [Candidatus Methanomethylophilaceae archaeon]|nr:hypothetical protein [Candidatus Methanomethylophilaceae archaeon]